VATNAGAIMYGLYALRGTCQATMHHLIGTEAPVIEKIASTIAE